MILSVPPCGSRSSKISDNSLKKAASFGSFKQKRGIGYDLFYGSLAAAVLVAAAPSNLPQSPFSAQRNVESRVPARSYSELSIGAKLLQKNKPEIPVSQYWKTVKDSLDGVVDSTTKKVVSPWKKFGIDRMLDADTALKRILRR